MGASHPALRSLTARRDTHSRISCNNLRHTIRRMAVYWPKTAITQTLTRFLLLALRPVPKHLLQFFSRRESSRLRVENCEAIHRRQAASRRSVAKLMSQHMSKMKPPMANG